MTLSYAAERTSAGASELLARLAATPAGDRDFA